MGTCWSKLVVRNYEAPRPLAFVVRPSGSDKGPGDKFRIPSAVTLLNGNLFFGWPGDTKSKKPGAPDGAARGVPSRSAASISALSCLPGYPP